MANDENTSIKTAESSISQFFISVLDAENEGANLTALIAQLITEVFPLNQAENHFYVRGSKKLKKRLCFFQSLQ